LEEKVTNPFEDENATYHVLINDEGQHSLWPSFVEIPEGWTAILKSDTRTACLDFINKNWTDLRPKGLIAAMDGSSDGGPPNTGHAGDTTESNRHDDLAAAAKKLH
jgi:MbtH protein